MSIEKQTKVKSDPFWYEKPEILFQSDRLAEFFPSKEQTLKEKLNSIMRLCLYTSILLYMYHKTYKYLGFALGGALFTVYIHNNYRTTTEQQRLDSANIESVENTQETCTKPTLDNPFMNVTMKDYMNIVDGKTVDRPPACDTSVPDIKKDVDNAFENNLYRDVDDVFGKFNSQRQFFTMPFTTIPNKQDEFARWLYASPKTCKEDQDYCLRYEDVRAKRPVFVNPNDNPTRPNAM